MSLSHVHNDDSIKVGFEALRVRTIVGLLPFERKVPQNIYVDVQVSVPVSSVNQEQINDELGRIPSYFELAEDTQKLIKEGQFKTLETICHRTALQLFTKYPLIESASIRVKKPQAIPNAQSATVSQTFFK